MFSLNYNREGVITRRSMMINEGNLQQSIRRLSTSKAFNTTSDGPATFSILEKIDTWLGASEQGVINGENGRSLLDTANAALSNIERIFVDISVLAEDASNGVWTDDQRAVFHTQVESLLSVSETIAESTNFLGNKLLDGSMQTLTLQIGITKQDFDTVQITMPDMRVGTLTQGMTTRPNGEAIDLRTQESALDSLGNVKEVLKKVRMEQANIGGTSNAIDVTLSKNRAMNDATKESRSALGDVDIAEEMECYTNMTAKMQASSYMFSIAMRNPDRISQLIQAI